MDLLGTSLRWTPQRRRRAATVERTVPPRKGEVYFGSAQEVTPLDLRGPKKAATIARRSAPGAPREGERREKTRDKRK